MNSTEKKKLIKRLVREGNRDAAAIFEQLRGELGEWTVDYVGKIVERCLKGLNVPAEQKPVEMEFSLAQYFYCPKCKNWFIGSDYLQTALPSYYGAWAANLVTHHRHCHIKSYDAAWSNPFYRKRIPNWNYDNYKKEINNRGKRQMIRALMKEKYSSRIKKKILNGFSMLQYNDGKTDLLIQKYLTKEGEP